MVYSVGVNRRDGYRDGGYDVMAATTDNFKRINPEDLLAFAEEHGIERVHGIYVGFKDDTPISGCVLGVLAMTHYGVNRLAHQEARSSLDGGMREMGFSLSYLSGLEFGYEDGFTFKPSGEKWLRNPDHVVEFAVPPKGEAGDQFIAGVRDGCEYLRLCVEGSGAVQPILQEVV